MTMYLGLFLVYGLPLLAIGGLVWWLVRKHRAALELERQDSIANKIKQDAAFADHARRMQESATTTTSTYAFKSPYIPQRKFNDNAKTRTTCAPKFTDETRTAPVRREESSSASDMLIGGAIGYALAGGFGGHAHASPAPEPSYSGGGGSFGGAGASSSWDSGSSSSSSSDSSSSSSDSSSGGGSE